MIDDVEVVAQARILARRDVAVQVGVAQGIASLGSAAIVPLSNLPTVAASRAQIGGVIESSAALGANVSAVGHPHDTQDPSFAGADGFGLFSALMTSDQAGTLLIESSPDGVTWSTEASVASATIAGKQVARFSGMPAQRYVRATLTNGVTPQTSGLLVTALTSLVAA